jgi:hypothetical protein
MVHRSVIAAVLVVLATAFAHAALAGASTDIGNAGDDLRTGWYPDASALSPAVVTGGTFGQLWSADVVGQVYAQPLYYDGTVIVATEENWVYGLNASTGAIEWSTYLGTAWNPGDIGCADISPAIGTTATPVIDPSTGTVYLTYKTYVSGSSGPAAWYMDAFDVASGAQRSGFPVELDGDATNQPTINFAPTTQQQRPGLLLTDGVVYAAFGGHCDVDPYQGWVFGVSTAGQVTTRWVDTTPGEVGGPGIWQSGVGLMSNAPGSIYLVTGNGGSPTVPAPGDDPPDSFGESVVHLEVQPNGSLEPVDFFTPFDDLQLDTWDGDFGAGGIVGLPPAYFGTSSIPNLGVVVGKEGYVYLLNLDSLGGFEQGTGGGDNVVQRIGPRGGVWGRPGVWPGDGGYVYITTSTGNSGGGDLDAYQYGLSGSEQPALSLVGTSSSAFGWGSGPAVVTSDGATSGTAVVWTVWSADRTGAGAQLRAYAPIPVDGQMQLLWSTPIGDSTNYSNVDEGGGRLYLGTRDGHILAFGSPVAEQVTGSPLSFAATTEGDTSQETLTLTANNALTIQSIASSSSQFTIGTPSQTLPAVLESGDTITVPVNFQPSTTGLIAGEVNVTLGDGSVASFSLSGTGQSPQAQLYTGQDLISLGGTTIGGELTGTATFSNVGDGPLTIQGVSGLSAPFSATGLPSVGATLDPGDSFTVTLDFDPTADGNFANTLEIDSTGGDVQVGVSASAAAPGLLEYSSESVGFGSVPIGTTSTQSFTITNTGGSTVTVNKSKPPFGGEFAPVTSLEEGTSIAPGASFVEQVSFTPTTTGPATGVWEITGDDGRGLQDIEFSGTGVEPTVAPTALPSSGSPLLSRAITLLHVVPKLVKHSDARGLKLSYVADAQGIAQIVLDRQLAGRLRDGRCAQPTPESGHDQRCQRLITVASFEHAGTAGENSFDLRDYVAVGRLPVGYYRLGIWLSGAAPAYRWFRLVG